MENKHVFVNLFGKSNNMKVLDYIINAQKKIELIANDIAEGTNLSRKTVDKITKQLVKEKILVITRTLGKVKLYKFNWQSKVCIKLVQINRKNV